MTAMPARMQRDSRIFESFANAGAFRDAAQAALKAFAYEKYNVGGGQVLLRAPGHQADVSWTRPPLWRPFKAKRLAVDGYEAPTIGLTSFVLRTFSISTMYDAGASHGFFSLIAAGTTGKSIVAHAFEMSPDRYKILLACIARNGVLPGKVVPHLSGLSDKHRGHSTVWFSRSNMFETKPDASEYREALHRRIKFALQGVWDRDALHEAQMLLTSMDAMSEQTGPPDFIKIDVDGYEGPILKGARETLTRHRPFVLLELHQDDHIVRTGWSRRSIADYMFGLGYSALGLTNHLNVSEADVVDLAGDSPMFDEQRTMMFLFY